LIAVDTSALARFIGGEPGEHTSRIRELLRAGTAYLPPAALTELLSNPDLGEAATGVVLSLPLLPLKRGYWQRAGFLRAELLRVIHKANIADVLIAQCCIDHDIPLITYDRDFRHFERAGLKLL
jgi:predicted nucleic acid-binding protein